MDEFGDQAEDFTQQRAELADGDTRGRAVRDRRDERLEVGTGEQGGDELLGGAEFVVQPLSETLGLGILAHTFADEVELADHLVLERPLRVAHFRQCDVVQGFVQDRAEGVHLPTGNEAQIDGDGRFALVPRILSGVLDVLVGDEVQVHALELRHLGKHAGDHPVVLTQSRVFRHRGEGLAEVVIGVNPESRGEVLPELPRVLLLIVLVLGRRGDRGDGTAKLRDRHHLRLRLPVPLVGDRRLVAGDALHFADELLPVGCGERDEVLGGAARRRRLGTALGFWQNVNDSAGLIEQGLQGVVVEGVLDVDAAVGHPVVGTAFGLQSSAALFRLGQINSVDSQHRFFSLHEIDRGAIKRPRVRIDGRLESAGGGDTGPFFAGVACVFTEDRWVAPFE